MLQNQATGPTSTSPAGADASPTGDSLALTPYVPVQVPAIEPSPSIRPGNEQAPRDASDLFAYLLHNRIEPVQSSQAEQTGARGGPTPPSATVTQSGMNSSTGGQILPSLEAQGLGPAVDMAASPTPLTSADLNMLTKTIGMFFKEG